MWMAYLKTNWWFTKIFILNFWNKLVIIEPNNNLEKSKYTG